MQIALRCRYLFYTVFTQDLQQVGYALVTILLTFVSYSSNSIGGSITLLLFIGRDYSAGESENSNLGSGTTNWGRSIPRRKSFIVVACLKKYATNSSYSSHFICDPPLVL